MRKFNIFIVFFALVLFVSAVLPPQAAALADPAVLASSALLVEVTSDKVLYDKNKDAAVDPGGAVKMMTVLLAVEAIENGQAALTDAILAGDAAFDPSGRSGAMPKIVSGEMLTLEDLLYDAYLAGDTNAAGIIATCLAGSTAAYVERMNKQAAALGCKNTHFTNVFGTADATQTTSAWDQYLIFKEALRHPLFLKIAETTAYQMQATNKSKPRALINGNLMLQYSSPYYEKNSVAGCAASSDAGEKSMTAYSKNDNLTLIAVTFGASDIPAPDGAIVDQRFTETKRLLDWGFAGFAWKVLTEQNTAVASEKIDLAEGTDIVNLLPSDTIKAVVRSDLTDVDIKKDIVYYGTSGGRTLVAPVRSGELLGQMTITVDGENCGTVGLVAASDVRLDKGKFIQKRLQDTLHNIWFQLGAAVFVILLGGYIYLIIRDRKARRGEEELRVKKEKKMKPEKIDRKENNEKKKLAAFLKKKD
ncbi:D-alanyl-D-alanine carboxypeptidase [Oscillospiraceae bacterium CM]|nr:D-alanyl-D-alanine carboxypeptidase [Oscillospiraceae bacterium CM]